ncbi:MAG: anaerobic sulfatase maturase [Clostridiales bacterium]|nr:anaerobic sulfatase maturase [Clostridiales bacterium]
MPPLNLLIKPASGSCNMACRYCFYADETEKRSVPLLGRMSRETLHEIVDRALAYADGVCTFSFQGGEPTLAGLDFYRDLADYAAKHPNPKGVRVQYSIQTNGCGLNEDWARWFSEHDVLVGVSLDGPKEFHDRLRKDREGKGTFQRVMQFIRLLEQYGVEYNILTVVSAANARHAGQLYNFFKKQGFRYQQYIECLDPLGEVPGGNEYSLTPERYEAFLKTTFDAWYQDMKAGHYVYNRYFENLMMILTGQAPESCSLRGSCLPQWVIEADGSVYPCDFYALDEWKLGNILEHSFEELEEARKKSGFIQWSCRLPEDCRSCRWLPLCRNGCRRNREPVTADRTGKNVFCSAYKNFLEYAYPRLAEICRILIRQARSGENKSV